MEIAAGSKYSSFLEFEEAFEKWKTTQFHPFRVASSETLRMPDGSANETFKYRYIVYHCAHYGAPRMRGAGKRPNQNYLPCGCRAMLRLNFSWSENALRITTLNCAHTGHEINQESFARFSAKVRRPCNGTPPAIKTERQQTPTDTVASSPLTPNQTPISTEARVFQPRVIQQDLCDSANKPAFKKMKTEKENFVEQEQLFPLDLTDKRSDEDRFQEMHACLQGITDTLMGCQGQEFDLKLRQLKVIMKGWAFEKEKPAFLNPVAPFALPPVTDPKQLFAQHVHNLQGLFFPPRF